jgi:hypothetical protein
MGPLRNAKATIGFAWEASSRLLQEIPLAEAKQAAVEDGVAAYENLLSKLLDVPTLAGRTRRQIGAELVQITSVRPAIPISTTATAKV